MNLEFYNDIFATNSKLRDYQYRIRMVIKKNFKMIKNHNEIKNTTGKLTFV